MQPFVIRACVGAAVVAALGLCPPPAMAAEGPPLVDLISTQDGAGAGFALRSERSLYRGAGWRNDFLPIYLYEGRHVFLEGYRAGFKLEQADRHRFDAFLAYRFEGYPSDPVPASLAGMAFRRQGVDLGIGYQYRDGPDTLYGELRRDISQESGGAEARVGYRYVWRSSLWSLRPQIEVSARNAKLNNYYYGVLPAEVTAARPAYEPGAGINGTLALNVDYHLTERWRLFGGVAATRWSSGVRASPIVENRLQLNVLGGLVYDFSPETKAWVDTRPLIVKAFYGKSTDCDVAKTMYLACTSTKTVDNTTVESIELGRPFIEGLNGWPLDIDGYVGLLHHSERGLQPDGWQANAYVKVYYYGFPWSGRVRTRIGLGAGLSYAPRIPYVEGRDQAARGRSTSHLLNYLDPTIDVSLGDIIGVKSMRETYVGVGVSHRSGIFGTSQLLGNVNGGSNYIYSYLEWRM